MKLCENYEAESCDEKCRPSALCPVSTASRAYCGVCDFNPNLYTCTRVLSEPDMPSSTESSSSSPKTLQPSEPAHARLCPTAEELIYTADSNTYYFTDTNLEPYTMYEYRVYAWNRGGHGFSLPSWVTTKEDVPQGVLPPRWSRVGLRDDIILLNWSSPIKTNGEISHYVVLRDGRERYRGTERSFTDAGGIRPFREYTYQLRACTTAGCTDSLKVSL
ncbi:usherin [Tachysurus ichikawai]